MTRVKAFITAPVAALAFAASAQAADMPGAWYPPSQRAAPAFTELMSGWYLRGDVGYRFNHVESVESSVPFLSQTSDNGAGVSVGLGYKYQWFRTDLTFDYGAQVEISGITATGVPQPQYHDGIDVASVLANFYVDLGTWDGFTPYVGVGAGISSFRGRDFVATALSTSVPVQPVSMTNFSWALMAGVSYQVLPTWVVDVGYRYLDLGDTASYGPSTSGSLLQVVNWKNLSAQEIRFGVRFLFD